MKLFCDLNSKTIIINEKQQKMLNEMIAYHGSKANFDEFNLAYMGSGIGAQEFGEGLYLTFDKDAAYSYGGNVYTVDIPNENEGKYIYYDRPISNEIFISIINGIIEDMKLQYPDEYQDEQSIEDLRKELYDIMEPSEGRNLMYNIHRYIDDPIVIPKILKRAGVTGFIYNNGKVDNVIMFSSKDIKILDKEIVSENKNYIEEEYFTSNELLMENNDIYPEQRKFHEGWAAVKVSKWNLNSWNFINKKGKFLSNDCFEQVEDFRNGMAVVRRGKKANIINKKGVLLLKVWAVDCVNGYKNNLSVAVYDISKDHYQYICVDKNGMTYDMKTLEPINFWQNESVKLKNHNFLFEQYLIEATLDDIYTKYYSNIPQDEFWQIIKADPTYDEQKSQKMGKYGKWLLNLYKQGRLKNEDLYKATDYLSYFVKYYNKITEKDINKIPDLPSLYNVIKPYKEAFDNGEEIATSKSDEVRKIKEGAEKVYEDGQWLVVVPHTKEASCYYGKGTQWCTAATSSDNMFEHYSYKGPLFINIRKSDGKKFQFHFETTSFMDETDTPIHTPIVKTIGLNSDLLQYYINEYGGKAAILLTCNNLDFDDMEIDGDDPYYVYNDYDGYWHIVEVNGINIKNCRGLEYDSYTSDNEIQSLGQGLFKLHNYELKEYYDDETDEWYNEGDYEISDLWSIYNARSGKTITLPEDARDIYNFNNKYFEAKINGKNSLVEKNIMKTVFQTNNLIQSAYYYLEHYKFEDNNRKIAQYNDNIIVLLDYSTYKTLGYSQNKVYDLSKQSYIVPPFDNYQLISYTRNDGYEYLTYKGMNSTDKYYSYCSVMPNGSLTEIYN